MKRKYNIKSPLTIKNKAKKRRCIARIGSGEICNKEFESYGSANRICSKCNYYINEYRRGVLLTEVYSVIFDD